MPHSWVEPIEISPEGVSVCVHSPPQGLGNSDLGGRQQRLPRPLSPSLPPLLLPVAASSSFLPATHTQLCLCGGPTSLAHRRRLS